MASLGLARHYRGAEVSTGIVIGLDQLAQNIVSEWKFDASAGRLELLIASALRDEREHWQTQMQALSTELANITASRAATQRINQQLLEAGDRVNGEYETEIEQLKAQRNSLRYQLTEAALLKGFLLGECNHLKAQLTEVRAKLERGQLMDCNHCGSRMRIWIEAEKK